MIRLTLLLCAAMFVTLAVGGRDFGQIRPGLSGAYVVDTALPKPARSAPQQAADVINANYTTDAAQTLQPSSALPLPLVQKLPVPIQEAAAPATEPSVAQSADAVWYVSAKAVNVREGPSTQYSVIDRLTRGEAATVVALEGNGWARIRIEGDGIEGYVSADFLTQDAPGN